MTSSKTYVHLKEKYDRVVVLIDMDCFYCQVEEFLDPERLTGKPIAVVQYLENAGIIAVNYAARALGITRHMRENEAKAFCKELICVKVPSKNGKADLTKYRDAGYEVAKVLQTFTPLLERASVDEAYLDITDNVMQKMQELRSNQFQLHPANFVNTFAVGYENVGLFVQDVTSSVGLNYDHVPEDERKAYASSKLRLLIGASIVNEIRRAVKEQTKYECSAGIGHNKILAKLTCGFNKPNKQTVLPIESITNLFNDLAVNKVKSLGGKLGEEVCSKLNAKTMSDILKYSESELQSHFQTRVGSWLYLMSRGIDLEQVTPKFMSKSIAVSKNFRGKNEISSIHTLKFWLKELSKEIVERLAKDAADCNRQAKHLSVSFTQGEAKVDKKNVSSSRVVPLNGSSLNTYSAEQIAQEVFDTIKKNSGKFVKSEGSVIMALNIKNLGINAGKFEDNNAAGSSKNLQNLLKNHQKKENKTSPAPVKKSQKEKVKKVDKSPENQTNDRSTAISMVQKFERKSPRVMMKVPVVEKIAIQLETTDGNPENLLAVSTTFNGENAIRGTINLKHWITQNMLEICKNIEIDSEINVRAPTEITVRYKQNIDGEYKENVTKFPLEGFTDGLIDVDVLIATLTQSEGFSTESGEIKNPIEWLQVFPSEFRDGKQWKYTLKHQNLQKSSNDECEMESDLNAAEKIDQTEDTDKNDEIAESKIETERVKKSSNVVENDKNEEQNEFKNQVNVPETTEELQKILLETSLIDEDDEENGETFQELIKSEQRKIAEEEEDSRSVLNAQENEGQTYSPAYDMSTDDEDIFENCENFENESEKLEENLPETSEIYTKTPEDLPEIVDNRKVSSKITSTSSHDKLPPSSSDTAGPSYLQTYAEFKLPHVSIDLLNPKEPCNECGKMIGKLDMISHLDHHLAFQISNQQREEYRKNQKASSSQTVVKKATKPKVQIGKPTQNLIQKYVFKKEDEQDAENRMQCEQCLKLIISEEYISHLDYHFAQKLREEELKMVKKVAVPKVEVKKPPAKRPGSTQKNLPKMKSVKTYFSSN